MHFFYFTKMTTVLNNDLNDTHDKNDDGFMNKIKKFKKNHSILFYVIISFIIVVLIGIIVVVVYTIVNKKKKKNEDSKEGYSASNNINDEFDYVNSVIYSTLGDISELEKINNEAVLL